ncbi:sensor histidine kinase regulating citrate/malate metabolism [Mycetocola sp. BIGb0189]|uniref:ATP-binding protein n=1 Tax=Mycetocola sp. BIGb0189 TaxID=2940604 RepID=UPI002167BA46|nr:ATP-binding protein [Mycetocola sp. BIGb0189]MCS4275859.1 sensor histidine kinase regulating citrate/malate metabolism [Mycetocola sp. BIGb0189]
MVQKRTRSASSSVFLALSLIAVILGLAVGGLLIWDRQRAGEHEAERATEAIATTLALSPTTRQALAGVDAGPAQRVEASTTLQPITRTLIDRAGITYITIMTTDGIRLTHREESQIGDFYLGTIPDTPTELTEVFDGTLGPSIRTIVPVFAPGGTELVGWVSAGVTLGTVGASIRDELPLILTLTAGLLAAGVVGALLGRHYTRRLTGDLSAADVRDATTSFESLRTLGAALRAQNHEHGNRLHTAVAMLELGRTREAITLLTETADHNQELVDSLAVPATSESTMNALLLGKTAQAAERGLDFETVIDPEAPALALSPIDAIAVVGNLIDNAFDAAASGEWPHTVHLEIRAAGAETVEISVTDSGAGFSEESRARMFDHGYSTKAAPSATRGIGLALVRDIVTRAGGHIAVDEHPTTLRVSLPAATGKDSR